MQPDTAEAFEIARLFSKPESYKYANRMPSNTNITAA
jgi:hypothetical protein